jgi:hypothetical protein
VLAVGTDRYDDPGISTLGFAAVDARGFAEAMRHVGPRLYADVQVETLIDSADLASYV